MTGFAEELRALTDEWRERGASIEDIVNAMYDEIIRLEPDDDDDDDDDDDEEDMVR